MTAWTTAFEVAGLDGLVLRVGFGFGRLSLHVEGSAQRLGPPVELGRLSHGVDLAAHRVELGVSLRQRGFDDAPYGGGEGAGLAVAGGRVEADGAFDGAAQDAAPVSGGGSHAGSLVAGGPSSPRSRCSRSSGQQPWIRGRSSSGSTELGGVVAAARSRSQSRSIHSTPEW